MFSVISKSRWHISYSILGSVHSRWWQKWLTLTRLCQEGEIQTEIQGLYWWSEYRMHIESKSHLLQAESSGFCIDQTTPRDQICQLLWILASILNFDIFKRSCSYTSSPSCNKSRILLVQIYIWARYWWHFNVIQTCFSLSLYYHYNVYPGEIKIQPP